MRIAYLVLLLAVCRPCVAQDAPADSTQSVSPPDVFPERRINWLKLVPNIARDQKDIWMFPLSAPRGRYVRPTLGLAVITASMVAAVDAPSGKYFRQTRSFDGFNRVFSGKNTAIWMFAAPSAFYGVSLLRRDSYGQHTFLLAGEAVINSEILTSVMKDVDRRMKPVEVPTGGDFSQTWFKSHAGGLVRGIGSFPSGHTIAAFSVATVFADRYPNPRWHKWAAYGAASLFGFSRISLQSHHPSDVFAGAFLGYAIAHYAVLHGH